MAVLPGSDEERALAALVAAAGKVLGRDNREVPEDFIAGLFALAAPEDIMRYDPRQLAGLAASAWSFMAVREPGAPKLRFEAFEAGPELRQRESVLKIVNDDMPFLVDSILAELSERGIDIRLIVHPVFGVARDASGRLTAFKGPRAPSAGLLRESFIHIHVAHIDEEARRAQIVEGIELALADVRAAVEDWRAMTACVAETITELKAGPPPLPVDEIAEVIAFLEWLAADNFTFLGTRELHGCAQGRRAGAGRRLRAGSAARAGRENPAPRIAVARIHPGNPRVPARAEIAHRHQVQRPLARAPARAHGLHRDQALRCRRHARRRGPHRRPLHLHRLYAIDPFDSLLAPQGRHHHAPRRLRSGGTFRQGTGQRAGELPARRIVPDRRGYALSIRTIDLAARRTPPGARAAAPRPLRSLRLGSGVRAARALRQQRAQVDRRLSRRDLQGTRQRLLSVLSRGTTGPGPFHHRAVRR